MSGDAKAGDHWRSLGPLSQFDPEGISAAELDGHPLAIYRQGESIRISLDRCPHRDAPLTRLGHLEGDTVTCTWHGWRFRLADGAHADFGTPCLKMLPAQIIDGDLYVDPRPLAPADDPWGF